MRLEESSTKQIVDIVKKNSLRWVQNDKIDESANKSEFKHIFLLFGLWSFITLCRPQDYLSPLAYLRPTLTLGVITILFFFLHVRNSQSIYKNFQFKLFLLLILLMIIGIPFSYYRNASLQYAFEYMSISIIFFILFYHIANTAKKLESLLFAYCFGASIYAIYVLLFGKLTAGRISFGTMFDSNDIAFFLINFIPFNLLCLTRNNNFFKRILAFVSIALSLIVLFKTGSRGGLVACLALFAYLLFIKTRTINLSFLSKFILIFLAFISLLTLSVNKERYKTILDVKTDYNVTGEQGRIAIWKTGLKMMLSEPLTGVGMGRFSEGVGRDRMERGLPSTRWQVAHNSFVQIGAEIGIFGLILFTLMTWNVFSITNRVIKYSHSERLVRISEMVRAGFIGHVVCAMFLSQAYSVYWIFYIALSAKLHRILEEET